MRKLKIYLAGACEFEKEDWRSSVTKYMEKYNVELLNPWNFEPEQLKGLQPNRLPSEIKTRAGKTLKVTHWHNLKYCDRKSAHYARNKKYGRRIIRYDMKTVRVDVDYVIANWAAATQAGAGTKAEVTEAFLHNVPVYVIEHKGVELPGWVEWCATEIFQSFEELYNFLDEELGS